MGLVPNRRSLARMPTEPVIRAARPKLRAVFARDLPGLMEQFKSRRQ